MTFMPNECGALTICGQGCHSLAVAEFYGNCETCWLALAPEQRAILQGREPPVVEIIHERTVTTHYPPKPWLGWRILAGAWRATMTAAVLWLAWRVTK